MPDVLLALRSLLRQPRRTAIALFAIGFGVVSLLLAGGFMEWIFWAMRESTIQSQLGHVQVVRPGYLEQGAADPYRYFMTEDTSRRTYLEKLDHSREVVPRINFNGLISHGEATVSFIGQGVDPARETVFSRDLVILEGTALAVGDGQGLLLGEGLAANLGAKPGDTVVLLATTPSGGINAVEGVVRGLFFTSNKEFDDAALRLPLSLAQQLLKTQGVHRWLLLLDDTAYTDTAVAKIKMHFAAEGAELEVVPWYRLADFYNKTVALFGRQLSVVAGIIGLIIVLSISNTMIMSVMERTREIGTLLALGNRRRQVLGLYVSEGLWLGIIGGLAGVVIGVVLAQLISAVGIPMPPPPGMKRGYNGEIMLTWSLIAWTWLLAVASTVLASLYPAWKASRLVIVDALRHGR